MASKSYPIGLAKIGSQEGFRLPKAFSHDHPHLVTAKGHIDTIHENTIKSASRTRSRSAPPRWSIKKLYLNLG
jgi:hypothetical protein